MGYRVLFRGGEGEREGERERERERERGGGRYSTVGAIELYLQLTSCSILTLACSRLDRVVHLHFSLS